MVRLAQISSLTTQTSNSPGAAIGSVTVDGGQATLVNCAGPDKRGVVGFNATNLDAKTQHTMVVEYSASSPNRAHVDVCVLVQSTVLTAQ